jgi:phosphatidylserine decarboxylase
VLASPVDGVLGASGTVTSGRLLQAKGRFYSAADLLTSEEEARRYEGGLFLTLYLSPRHYHRIHAPTGDGVTAARHVPGALLPVNGPAVNGIENLFPRNERLICFMDGALGRVAVVAVGAYNVGRISARFDAAWGGGEGASVANRRVPPPSERRYDPPVAVAQGDEIMAFHLGSTVVLLTEPGTLRHEPGRGPGREVRLGDALARAGRG